MRGGPAAGILPHTDSKAEQEHAKRAAAIQAEIEALEKRSQTEEAHWDKEKERLQAALRRARG